MGAEGLKRFREFVGRWLFCFGQVRYYVPMAIRRRDWAWAWHFAVNELFWHHVPWLWSAKCEVCNEEPVPREGLICADCYYGEQMREYYANCM
jgi:hypothetical protein